MFQTHLSASWIQCARFLPTFSLRHVEYYRGILFFTTNRVQAFDEAFFSRVHVALHFHEQVAELARRDVNGRQIKNAARTAQSLEVGGETLEACEATLNRALKESG